MKITLESTPELVTINGVPARVWTGKTAAGVPIQALITHIAVHKDADASELERELKEATPPREGERAFPMRMLID